MMILSTMRFRCLSRGLYAFPPQNFQAKLLPQPPCLLRVSLKALLRKSSQSLELVPPY